jgi:1-deoxy-D-xylulose 5-phosphate reductoisomerase
MKTARDHKTQVVPVDSEHSAIWQCLQAGSGRKNEVRGIILTASGGPFFGRTRGQLFDVTVEQAMAHPNWSMGGKITIDCATMMNKGLEFIEAMWLFDLDPAQIEVVVHRQSIVHSAVDFVDGSVIAQMGVPDMRVTIQYAITYPLHMPLDTKRLSLTDYGLLTFEKAGSGDLRVPQGLHRGGGTGRACPLRGQRRKRDGGLAVSRRVDPLFADRRACSLRRGGFAPAALLVPCGYRGGRPSGPRVCARKGVHKGKSIIV